MNDLLIKLAISKRLLYWEGSSVLSLYGAEFNCLIYCVYCIYWSYKPLLLTLLFPGLFQQSRFPSDGRQRYRVHRVSAVRPRSLHLALIRWDPESYAVIESSCAAIITKVDVHWERFPESRCRRRTGPRATGKSRTNDVISFREIPISCLEITPTVYVNDH